MRLLVKILFILSTFTVLSCAKQSTPMGGPKDETAPILMAINPPNESRSVNPSIIELVFDEFIKLDNPTKGILITPRMDKSEMEFLANKRTVTIKLNQELEENTTYVFNFQKAIQDITENNAPENLKLVFSTGPDIDSLRYSGNVQYIFPQKDKIMKDVLVGLYQVTDTTNVLTAPPYYTIQTDSSGNFQFSNLKGGKYFTYAWFDSNNSLKAEDKTEPYGFILDTLHLDRDITDAQLYLSMADISELKINRATQSGANFDIVVSKTPAELNLEHDELNKDIFYRLNDKTIRLYSKKYVNDSTAVRLMVKDSVGFTIDTTLYAKFSESDRAKEKLEVTTAALPFIKSIRAEFNFNKPLLNINYDSLYISYDSAYVIPIDRSMVFLQDSLTRRKLLITYTPSDTISTESFKLIAGDSTFFDIDGMTNEKDLTINTRKIKPDVFADGVSITVETEELPIILQILNSKGEVVHERYLTETNKANFTTVEAGTYAIRAIIDRNRNRRWDTSNILENRQAEPVYYMKSADPDKPLDIIIKAGWELSLPIEPRKEPGPGKTKQSEAKNEDKDVDNTEN